MLGSQPPAKTVLQPSELSTDTLATPAASEYFSCDASNETTVVVSPSASCKRGKRPLDHSEQLERKHSRTVRGSLGFHADDSDGVDDDANGISSLHIDDLDAEDTNDDDGDDSERDAQQQNGKFECTLPSWDENPDAWAFLQSLSPRYKSHYLTRQGAEEIRTGYLFGRADECDFRFQRLEISARHCHIYLVMNGRPSMDQHSGHYHRREFSVYLEDLSTNGTFVNGEKIGREHRVLLNSGDRIQLYRRNMLDDDNPHHLFYRIIFPPKFEAKAFNEVFRMRDKLGEGNFATVFQAYPRREMAVPEAERSYVAVKALNKSKFARKPRLLRSLVQEISILMSLEAHPNVIKIDKVFDEAKHIFVVLEYAKDKDLFEFVTERKFLSEEETRFIFYQLFAGTQFLHHRNIVHRDLKPENVLMVDKSRLHVKITDFGLAKTVYRSELLDSQCGTPNYVAPEVLDPTGIRGYSKPCDVWSLGVMLYICLCGFPPFSDEGSPSLREQIKRGLYTYPRNSPWDFVHEEARNLIDVILTVDPTQRITLDNCQSHPWMHQDRDLLESRVGNLGEASAKLIEKYLHSSLNCTQSMSTSFGQSQGSLMQ
ncbi:kinase-like domain-containing protein [Gongronella butleri]|nr:kinase-like domain-containing protein [Gongronella butleri]